MVGRMKKLLLTIFIAPALYAGLRTASHEDVGCIQQTVHYQSGPAPLAMYQLGGRCVPKMHEYLSVNPKSKFNPFQKNPLVRIN